MMSNTTPNKLNPTSYPVSTPPSPASLTIPPRESGAANRRFTSTANYGRNMKGRLTSKRGWIGEYNYAWLCAPTLPFMNSKSRRIPPFYGLDDELPLLLALVAGFQHALAMLGGLITPPIIFASTLNLDAATQAYMVSSSLIACGILSLVQISRFKLWRGYYLGTGLLSVVGTSFAPLSAWLTIFNTFYADGTCPSTKGLDGSITLGPCPDAYGMLLGTSLVCAFIEVFMSFVPVRVLQKVFPPVVTGTVILLIGSSLIGSSGLSNWGGGSNCMSFPQSGIFQKCPTITAPKPALWGSPELIGLGFLSFVSILLTEIFGSPFLRSCSIVVGLAVGCIVAGAAGYIDGSSIKSAPVITFLWVHTFKIRVHGPAILPMLAVYISLAMEAIGDITASAEASRVEVDGPEFDTRIQGGILSDGIGGFLAGLFTVAPLSVFAQNNGVIILTRCANRTAGRFCCAFIILFGILGKVSGVFLAIPNSVLGGVTTFLFGNVAVSGIRVLAYISWSRRNRFILASALSFGIGELIVPGILTHLFDGVSKSNKGLTGLFECVTVILTTPFLIGGLIAVILNSILPSEEVAAMLGEDVDSDEPKHAP